MEAGRTDELTVLTPSEIHWIQKALGPRDRMASDILAKAKGRTILCRHGDATGAACGKAATHYTADAGSGELTGYCLEHWRQEGDPNDILGLHAPQNARRAAPTAK